VTVTLVRLVEPSGATTPIVAEAGAPSVDPVRANE
jgi:hypothetical protein